jgi:hypothetical protein
MLTLRALRTYPRDVATAVASKEAIKRHDCTVELDQIVRRLTKPGLAFPAGFAARSRR